MIEKLISQSPWHDAVHLPQAHGTVRRVKIMVQDDPAKISVEHHSICECWAIKTEWGMEWCECLQFKIMIMHLLWTHAARIEWGEKVKNVTRIGELNGNDSIYTRQKKSWHEFTFLFNCNYSARRTLCRKKNHVSDQLKTWTEMNDLPYVIWFINKTLRINECVCDYSCHNKNKSLSEFDK